MFKCLLFLFAIFFISFNISFADSNPTDTPLQSIIEKEAPVEKRLKREKRKLTRKERRRLRRELEGPQPYKTVKEAEEEVRVNSVMPEKKLQREQLVVPVEAKQSEGIVSLVQSWLVQLSETIQGEIESKTNILEMKKETVEKRPPLKWNTKKTWSESFVWEPLVHQYELFPLGESQNNNEGVQLIESPKINQAKGKKPQWPKLKGRGFSRRNAYGPHTNQGEDELLWPMKVQVKKANTALRLNFEGAPFTNQNIAFISVTTKSGMISQESGQTFSWWHRVKDIHQLKRNHLYQLEIYPGYRYKKITKYIYTDQSHKSLDIELSAWTTPIKRNRIVQYYTDIHPVNNGRRWNSSFYKLSQRAMGADIWAITHPVRMWLNNNAPRIELPYDAFWQMTQEKNRAGREKWIPLQKFTIDGVGLNVLGAQGKVRVRLLKDKMQGMFDIINEGHALGGIIGLSTPSGTIKINDGEFAPLELLLYSNAGIDFIETSNREDEKIIHRLYEKGIRVPFVQSQQENFGYALPVPNMQLVRDKKSKTGDNMLTAIKEGRMMMGSGFHLDFKVKDNQGRFYRLGEIAPLPSSGNAVYQAYANLEVNPDFGDVRRVSLILNGKIAQPTNASFGMTRCIAEFKPIRFHEGDSLQFKVWRKGGGQILTNPIYFGDKVLPFKKEVRKVPVHIVLKQANEKVNSAFSVMVRGKKFFKEKSLKNGEGYFELPLDSKIELYGKNQFKKIFLSAELSKSLQEQELANAHQAKSDLDSIDNLFPYKLVVNLDAP